MVICKTKHPLIRRSKIALSGWFSQVLGDIDLNLLVLQMGSPEHVVQLFTHKVNRDAFGENCSKTDDLERKGKLLQEGVGPAVEHDAIIDQ